MADPFDEWISSIPGGTQIRPYQQMNGSQTRAAGSMNNISPGPPIGTGPVANPSSQPVPMSAQQIALLIAMGTPQAYQPGMADPTTIFGGPQGAPAGSLIQLPTGGAAQSNVPGMPVPPINTGGAIQTNVPGMPMNPNGSDPRFPFGAPTQVDPISSSGLPVNEALLAQYIYQNPELAISMGGVAQPGTPGYNNLANMGFDPMAVFLASGGSPTQTNGTEYAQWLANFYSAMGTPSNQGGGSVNAGALLGNLVAMGSNTELGGMMAEDPTVFVDMANQVMQASGTSPFAQQAFKSQIATLMTEYMEYAVGKKSGDILPINQWIAKFHPEVVAAWTGGGGL